MISLEKACNNIIKDVGWFNNFLLYLIIMLVCYVPQIIFSATRDTSASAMKSMEEITGYFASSSILMILSIVGALFVTGFYSVYLRNLLAEENAPMPNVINYLKETMIAGLKSYAAFIVYYIGLILLSLIGILLLGAIGMILTFGNVPIQAIAIGAAVITISLLAIILGIYYPALLINFAAKNLEISAFFDFKGAAKYFCKAYWKAIFVTFGLSMVMMFALVIICGIFFLAGFKTVSSPVLALILYCFIAIPMGTFVSFIYINLLSQVYYSKIENK